MKTFLYTSRRYILLFVLLLAFVFLLPAQAQTPAGLGNTDWPTFQHDNFHTGRSPHIGIMHEPVVLWKKTWHIYGHQSGGMSLAEDGTIYLSGHGKLRTFDPIKRDFKWTYEDSVQSMCIPAVGQEGTIYWGHDYDFAAFTPDGAMIWRIQILYGNPLFRGSIAIDEENNLYFSRGMLWSFTSQGVLRWTAPMYPCEASTPAIGTDGTIYVAGADLTLDGRILVALSPQGTVKWKYLLPSEWCFSPAIGTDGTIYIVSEQYPIRLLAVNPDGTQRWIFDTGEWEEDLFVYGALAIGSDGTIYLNSSKVVYAVSSDGKLKWKRDYRLPRIYQALTVDKDNHLQLCGQDGTDVACFGLDADGNLLWKHAFAPNRDVLMYSETAPMIADDGLEYVFAKEFFGLDEHPYSLIALADPTLYPLLYALEPGYDLTVAQGDEPLTRTLTISSTLQPLSWTVAISPTTTTWVTFTQSSGVTPTQIELTIHPGSLDPGAYHVDVVLETVGKIGRVLPVPLRINVAPRGNLYLPIVYKESIGHFTLLYQYGNRLRSINEIGEIKHLTFNEVVYNQAAWSPDGDKFVFVEDLNHPDLYTMRPDGSGLKRLTWNYLKNESPNWSPDGKKITFVTTDNAGGKDIYSMNADGSGLTRLTSDSPNQETPLWSPNGNQIAYMSTYFVTPERDDGDIWVMNADGSGKKQLTDMPGYEKLMGWSPDGQKLLLIYSLNAWYDGADIYVINANGSGLINLTNKQWPYREAIWSPDGRYIAYTQIPKIQGYYDVDLFIMNADGTNIRQLTDTPLIEEMYMSWSPDGKFLLYGGLDPHFNIYILNPFTMYRRQVLTEVDYYQRALWKP